MIMKPYLTPHGSKASMAARLAPCLFLGAATLGACGGSTADSSDEATAKAESALNTCVTIQNVGPTTTFVDDAAISTDPTDPTKANTNYGSVNQLTAGFVGTEYRRLLLKFDPIGAGIPSDAVVSSATLRLRMTQSLGKNPVDFYAGTSLWDEHVATWNQIAAAPNGGLGSLQATLATLGVPNSSYVDIPLPAALIESWLAPSSNYGLVLDHPQAGRTTFGASEAGAASRPTLQVCYDPASCSDGRQDQGETGVDCGGPCPTICCADVPETCNGIDDNCNGQIDENVTQDCSTACEVGIETCSAGAWSSCSALAPQTCLDYATCQQESQCVAACAAKPAEVCNLKDDDCNAVCDGAQCQVGVHRSYNALFADHLYTIDFAEATGTPFFALEAANYFHLYKASTPGVVPLYKCRDVFTGKHFLSTAGDCGGMENQGLQGYISTQQKCGSKALYFLYNTFPFIGGDHVFTTDPGERAALLAAGWWQDLGITGYVW